MRVLARLALAGFLTVHVYGCAASLPTHSVSSNDRTLLAAPAGLATVTVDMSPGRAIPPDFLGFSHEWGTAQKMMGDSETGLNTIYRQLLKNLKAYGSGPFVLRIGGNSTDNSGEPTPATVRPFAELANDLDVSFYLGVNLGAGNVSLAASQARMYVRSMPPRSIEAIEIGNEPDEYATNGKRSSSYDFHGYLSDFDRWKANIAPLLPAGTKLLGPSWATTAMLVHTSDYVTDEHDSLGTFSQHFYVANGTAPNPYDILLRNSAATKGPKAVESAVTIVHQAGLPFRMGEINSLYNGGGSGISDTFQSALWAIDTMFEYEQVGVDGVNWHCGNGGSYAAFSFNIRTKGARHAFSLQSVRPLYYGLLLFQAATGNGAHLLPVSVHTHANVKAWATLDKSGVLRLVLINKDENLAGSVNIALHGFKHANVFRLKAPNYLATSGITFAGQTFDHSADGSLQGKQTPEWISAPDGDFHFEMPITSAALIVMSK